VLALGLLLGRLISEMICYALSGMQNSTYLYSYLLSLVYVHFLPEWQWPAEFRLRAFVCCQGLPMKLTYFVGPYDLLNHKTLRPTPMTIEGMFFSVYYVCIVSVLML